MPIPPAILQALVRRKVEERAESGYTVEHKPERVYPKAEQFDSRIPLDTVFSVGANALNQVNRIGGQAEEPIPLFDRNVNYGKVMENAGYSRPVSFGVGLAGDLVEPGPGELKALGDLAVMPLALRQLLGKTTKVVDSTGAAKQTLHGTRVTYIEPDLRRDTGQNLFGPGYYTTEGVRKPPMGLEEQRQHFLTHLREQASLYPEERVLERDIPLIEAATNLDELHSVASKHYTRTQLDRLTKGIEPITAGYAGEPITAKWYNFAAINIEAANIAAEREILVPGGNPIKASKILGAKHDPKANRYVVDYLDVDGKPQQTTDAVGMTYNAGAPQVRSQYLDIRNPFDIDKTYTPDEMEDLHDALLNTSYDKKYVAQQRAALPQVREALQRYPELEQKMNDQGWAALTDEEQLLVDVAENVPHRKLLTEEIKGQDLYHYLTDLYDPKRVQEIMKQAGFDGITHVGGARTGNEAHQVWIAFDEDQIYSGASDVERMTERAIKENALSPEQIAELMQLVDQRAKVAPPKK